MLNDDLREENLKLRAENRRLRDALDKINDICNAAKSDLLPGTHHDVVGGGMNENL